MTKYKIPTDKYTSRFICHGIVFELPSKNNSWFYGVREISERLDRDIFWLKISTHGDAIKIGTIGQQRGSMYL
jgi:hypothetical protein